MIGFAAIAGGTPASVGPMTDHLVNHTLASDQEKLAAYYSKGAPLATIRPDLHPRVALTLGISPGDVLTHDQISGLLAGRTAAGNPIEGKHYAPERTLPRDPKTGAERVSTPIGSYDFCPTPDKSISVLWAFSEPVQQAQILRAHTEAARDAVAYIASEVGQARVGKGGRDGAERGSVAWLEFTHHTSRRVVIADGKFAKASEVAGDPDLHTHFLIPNLVACSSGRVGSLDTAAIGGFIFQADAYYHGRLADKLRTVGYAIDMDHRTGAARAYAVPEEVRDLFSKRTMDGKEQAKSRADAAGIDWDGLASEQKIRWTKNGTQSRKQRGGAKKDDIADFDSWRDQAAKLGWRPKDVDLLLYGPPPPPLTDEQRHRQAYEIALPILAEKFEHKAVLSHHEIRTVAARGLVQAGMQGGVSDIDAVTRIMRTEGVIQYGDRTPLVWGIEEGKRYVSVTTGLHERDEREFVALAKAAADDHTGTIPTGLLAQHMAASGLDFSDAHGKAQRKAIEGMAAGGKFGMAIGSAGAGKTEMLKPLAASWKDQGRAVFGASLAWRQADDLVKAGIDGQNVAAFSVLVENIKSGRTKLDKTAVVAVDELGLLGTRQGLELLRLQEKHGFTIVALGDDKQCASPSAGSIIGLTRRALGDAIPEIHTTKRQSGREAVIAGLFREGRAAEALDMKRQDRSAEMVSGGYDSVVARVAKIYVERVKATGQAPTISAPTNADAHRIGEAVRAERRTLGLVGDDSVLVKATDGVRDYDLPLAPGDRVRLFRSVGGDFGNKRGGNIGRNGSVLEVVSADTTGLSLKAASGKVGRVTWSALTLKDGRAGLAYGDAMTVHGAQGGTWREHVVALPAGSQATDGLTAYSALTRHRQASFLVTNEAAEREAVRKSRPLNDMREISADAKWASVAASFAHQPAKDTALDLMGRVAEIRRGSVAKFQTALAQPASTAHETADLIKTSRVRMQVSATIRQATAVVGDVRQTIHDHLSRIKAEIRAAAWGSAPTQQVRERPPAERNIPKLQQ